MKALLFWLCISLAAYAKLRPFDSGHRNFVVKSKRFTQIRTAQPAEIPALLLDPGTLPTVIVPKGQKGNVTQKIHLRGRLLQVGSDSNIKTDTFFSVACDSIKGTFIFGGDANAESVDNFKYTTSNGLATLLETDPKGKKSVTVFVDDARQLVCPMLDKNPVKAIKVKQQSTLSIHQRPNDRSTYLFFGQSFEFWSCKMDANGLKEMTHFNKNKKPSKASFAGTIYAARPRTSFGCSKIVIEAGLIS